MLEPVSLNPDVKALLDGAYDAKATADRQRNDAEAARVEKERAALTEASRYLEQVVRPGLDVLCKYLQGRGTKADIQSQQGGPHTIELRLVWGRNIEQKNSVPSNRTQHAQHNTFRVAIGQGGKFAVISALMGEDFVNHESVPSPITTEWIQAEAAKVIKRSILP